MKKTIATVSILIVILTNIVILPFFLAPSAKESLAVGSTMLSTMATLITLWIAVSLYSKYGIEKSVVDKQMETVLRLLGELKKTRFLCNWDNGMLQLRLDLRQGRHWENYKNRKLLFDGGYAEGLSGIWEIADDIFLPMGIAEKIKPLRVEIIMDDQKSSDYLTVEIPGFSHKAKDNHFFGLLNGKQISVKEFIGYWDLVIKEAKKWLKSHSGKQFTLNFERK